MLMCDTPPLHNSSVIFEPILEDPIFQKCLKHKDLPKLLFNIISTKKVYLHYHYLTYIFGVYNKNDLVYTIIDTLMMMYNVYCKNNNINTNTNVNIKSKRKTSKRKTSKRRLLRTKRKTSKRKTSKRKTTKRRTTKRRLLRTKRRLLRTKRRKRIYRKNIRK